MSYTEPLTISLLNTYHKVLSETVVYKSTRAILDRGNTTRESVLSVPNTDNELPDALSPISSFRQGALS